MLAKLAVAGSPPRPLCAAARKRGSDCAFDPSCVHSPEVVQVNASNASCVSSAVDACDGQRGSNCTGNALCAHTPFAPEVLPVAATCA